MKFAKFPFLFLITFLMACNAGSHFNYEDITDSFRDDLSVLLGQYFELKNALVQSDAKTVAAEAGLIHKKVAAIHYSPRNAEMKSAWNETKVQIRVQSKNISSEDDIGKQRQHFAKLSDAVIHMVSVFRPAEYAVYRQSCQMFGKEGADWLSREREIRNPYFGAEMPDCGEQRGQMAHRNHHNRGTHH